MLLFLDEAKTKRHVFKERCQQRFVNYYTGQITERSKDPSALCALSVSRMSPKGKKRFVGWWVRVETLYIFILFYSDYFFSIIPQREIVAQLNSNFLKLLMLF